MRNITLSINRKLIAGTILSLTIFLPSAFAATAQTEQGRVTSVVDGDTFKVKLGKKIETVRIIGIDTPETKDPRKPVQCYGKEASKKLTKFLRGKTVTLEKNPAEDRDKYKRLLRYVLLKNKDIGASMIEEGYAFSYKQFPHPRLEDYNELEKEAQGVNKGLWGSVCQYNISGASTSSVKSQPKSSASSAASSTPAATSCVIKGNISSKKEKIFHVPGCGSYSATQIDEAAGEQWFCSEQEAVAAGWRKALNCN
jgi:micrococcal nuclease